MATVLQVLVWVLLSSSLVLGGSVGVSSENPSLLQALTGLVGDDELQSKVAYVAGSSPEVKISISVMKGCPVTAIQRSTCATNPQRDCSCFEGTRTEASFTATIRPSPKAAAFSALCQKDSAGKLWTTILQRERSSTVNFTKTFAEYEAGFGTPSDTHFIGLKNLHTLTMAEDFKLKILMQDSEEKDSEGLFSTIRVDGPQTQYTLTLQHMDQESTVGERMLRDSDGHKFSTPDNDATGDDACASRHRAGFWFRKTGAARCSKCNPTGPPSDPEEEEERQFGCDEDGDYKQAQSMTFSVYPRDTSSAVEL